MWEEVEVVIECCGEVEEGAVKMRKFAKRALTSEKNFLFVCLEVDEVLMMDELLYYFVNFLYNMYLDGG